MERVIKAVLSVGNWKFHVAWTRAGPSRLFSIVLNSCDAKGRRGGQAPASGLPFRRVLRTRVPLRSTNTCYLQAPPVLMTTGPRAVP